MKILLGTLITILIIMNGLFIYEVVDLNAKVSSLSTQSYNNGSAISQLKQDNQGLSQQINSISSTMPTQPTYVQFKCSGAATPPPLPDGIGDNINLNCSSN